jgi:hypothetical protein
VSLLSQKQEVPKSAVFDRKIEQATSGLAASCAKALHSLSEVNATIIADYMAAIRFEINPSDQYRRSIIETLCVFAKFTDNRSFKDVTKDNIISFLESIARLMLLILFINGLAHTTFLECICLDSLNGFTLPS